MDNIKVWTLSELENLIGKEQLNKLFIEHYLTLIGQNFNSLGVIKDES